MVTATPSRSADKRTALLFCGLFALGGSVLLALSLIGLASSLYASQTRAPLIAFHPHDAIAIGPAISLFAFASMTMLPNEQRGSRQSRTPRASRGADPATILLGVAFLGIALSFIASPVVQITFARLVEQRGYVQCPAPKTWDRHAPLRWALPGAQCP